MRAHSVLDGLKKLSLTYTLLIGFIVFAIWALVFNIDQTILTQGQVVSAAKTQIIQSVDGGVLDELKVREGDSVASGQVLAILQSDIANAGYQTALAELDSNREILTSIEQELAVNQGLLKTGDVGYLEVVRLRRQMVEMRGRVRVGEQKLAQQRIGLDRTELRSPVDGTIKFLKVSTIGGVLKPGEEIMQIAPSSNNLIIEVRVNPADIGSLKVGMPASVKLEAFDYSVYGALHGIVSDIGPDTLTEQSSTGQPMTYYRAHIEIPEAELKGLQVKSIQLKLGMAASADIKTGSRSLMGYLMKPIYKGFDGALHEK